MIEVEGMAKRFGSTETLAGVDLVAEEARSSLCWDPTGWGRRLW
jgi:hypothetical protein